MRVFADTSALHVLLDADDADHDAVTRTWMQLRESESVLTTTNYVLVEALSLCQRRLGMAAARVLTEDLTPLLQIEWVSRETHAAGTAAMLAANRRDLSLVDCVSFEAMRRLGIRRAFALDEHFREQGFEVMP